MAIIGIQLDRKNPEFTFQDFLFWMPQYRAFIATSEGGRYFDKIYSIVNGKIFHSIFGVDWELAMSYAIAHYLCLVSTQMQNQSGDSLETLATGGTPKSVLASASVGNFSKSYDLDKTMLTSAEASFWNQTSYGTALMTLLKTKAVPSILVVTSNSIPGAD